MNWYKTSSRNVQITDKMKFLAIEIADTMMQYYGKNFNPEYLGSESFENPYNNEVQKINVVVFDKPNDFIAIYAPSNKILNVYPNSLITNNIDKNLIKEYFRQAIIHELVHTVDPWMQFIKIEDQKKQSCDNYTLYYEFNAYVRQICENVLFLISQNNFEHTQIKQWLEKENSFYPESIKPYIDILDCWKYSDKIKGTSFIKLFKKKLYDFIFNIKEAV